MNQYPPAKSGNFPRCGRPRHLTDEARRRQLLEAAEDAFFEKGYHATTMADIAQRAGMSKKTLYQVFASKELLFEALLADHLAIARLPVEDDGTDPAAALEAILLHVATVALSPRTIRLMRLLIGEGQRSPEIARAFEAQGLGRGKGTLERLFALQADRGTLEIDDPLAASQLMFGLALGDLTLTQLLRGGPPPEPEVVERRVRQAVRIFLRGYF